MYKTSLYQKSYHYLLKKKSCDLSFATEFIHTIWQYFNIAKICFLNELFTRCKFNLHPLFEFFIHVKHMGVFLVDIFTVPSHDYTVKNYFLNELFTWVLNL